jgi:hypothetical protein
MAVNWLSPLGKGAPALTCVLRVEPRLKSDEGLTLTFAQD